MYRLLVSVRDEELSFAPYRIFENTLGPHVKFRGAGPTNGSASGTTHAFADGLGGEELAGDDNNLGGLQAVGGRNSLFEDGQQSENGSLEQTDGSAVISPQPSMRMGAMPRERAAWTRASDPGVATTGGAGSSRDHLHRQHSPASSLRAAPRGGGTGAGPSRSSLTFGVAPLGPPGSSAGERPGVSARHLSPRPDMRRFAAIDPLVCSESGVLTASRGARFRGRLRLFRRIADNDKRLRRVGRALGTTNPSVLGGGHDPSSRTESSSKNIGNNNSTSGSAEGAGGSGVNMNNASMIHDFNYELLFPGLESTNANAAGSVAGAPCPGEPGLDEDPSPLGSGGPPGGQNVAEFCSPASGGGISQRQLSNTSPNSLVQLPQQAGTTAASSRQALLPAYHYLPLERSSTLCLLAVPFYMTEADLERVFADTIKMVEEYRVIEKEPVNYSNKAQQRAGGSNICSEQPLEKLCSDPISLNSDVEALNPGDLVDEAHFYERYGKTDTYAVVFFFRDQFTADEFYQKNHGRLFAHSNGQSNTNNENSQEEQPPPPREFQNACAYFVFLDGVFYHSAGETDPTEYFRASPQETSSSSTDNGADSSCPESTKPKNGSSTGSSARAVAKAQQRQLNSSSHKEPPLKSSKHSKKSTDVGATTTSSSSSPWSLQSFELPTCPYCLERLDVSVTGILCHGAGWLSAFQWYEIPEAIKSCPACVAIETAADSGTLNCSVCGTEEEIWVCLACGQAGCGRYSAGKHSLSHYQNSSGPLHRFCMELRSGRIWDYLGDVFVHRRLLQSMAQSRQQQQAALVDEQFAVEGNPHLSNVRVDVVDDPSPPGGPENSSGSPPRENLNTPQEDVAAGGVLPSKAVAAADGPALALGAGAGAAPGGSEQVVPDDFILLPDCRPPLPSEGAQMAVEFDLLLADNLDHQRRLYEASFERLLQEERELADNFREEEAGLTGEIAILSTKLEKEQKMIPLYEKKLADLQKQHEEAAEELALTRSIFASLGGSSVDTGKEGGGGGKSVRTEEEEEKESPVVQNLRKEIEKLMMELVATE